MTPATKKDNNEAAEFLDNFTDFLGDSEEQNLDDIRKELSEEGIDVDNIIAKVRSMLDTKIAETRRAWLKEAPAKLAKMLYKFNNINAEIPENVPELRKIIENIINSGDKELVLAFRNFKDLPDEDLIKLYSDYLKLLYLQKEKDEKRS